MPTLIGMPMRKAIPKATSRVKNWKKTYDKSLGSFKDQEVTEGTVISY